MDAALSWLVAAQTWLQLGDNEPTWLVVLVAVAAIATAWVAWRSLRAVDPAVPVALALFLLVAVPLWRAWTRARARGGGAPSASSRDAPDVDAMLGRLTRGHATSTEPAAPLVAAADEARRLVAGCVEIVVGADRRLSCGGPPAPPASRAELLVADASPWADGTGRACSARRRWDPTRRRAQRAAAYPQRARAAPRA